MISEYKGYKIKYDKCFAGVYFNDFYIANLKTENLAIAFIEERIRNRVIVLAKLEIIALADKAHLLLDTYESNYPNKEQEQAAWEYLEHSREAETALEKEIVKSIEGILPKTLAFLWGYEDALANLDCYSYEQEADDILSANEDYYEQKEIEKRKSLANRARKLLGNINNEKFEFYSDLLKIDEKFLNELHSIERMYVDILESENELIDGITGGHHVERRDIFWSAINEHPMEDVSADIYMSENGDLNFDLKEHLEVIANY